MLRIDKLLPVEHRLANAWRQRATNLVLPYGDRCRSRLLARLVDGTEVGLFLPRGSVLRTGTMLVAEDGRLVRVEAAAQPVLQATSTHLIDLMRAAYHLGNRHTPVQISLQALRIEQDPVLADMLRRLGLYVEAIDAPFEPESGAYGGGHRHGLDETFDEDYALAQAAFAHHHGATPSNPKERGA